MKVSKNFASLVKTVQEENAKLMPDLFTPVGKPEATDISREELGEPDEFGRFTLTHKDMALKARFDRGVADNLDAYNLQLKESNRPMKFDGQTIDKGYRVFRLVAA